MNKDDNHSSPPDFQWVIRNPLGSYLVCSALGQTGFLHGFGWVVGRDLGRRDTSDRLSGAFPQVTTWRPIKQCHGNRVADGQTAGRLTPQADAIHLTNRGDASWIRTADCLPIIVFDSIAGEFSLVHAGWRGTIDDILIAAIDKFTDPRRLQIAIGPCIRASCYEVGRDIAELFLARGWKDAVQETPEGRYFLDLAKTNTLQAMTANVSPRRIYDCRICNHCQVPQMPSYRVEGEKAGRMITFAALVTGGS